MYSRGPNRRCGYDAAIPWGRIDRAFTGRRGAIVKLGRAICVVTSWLIWQVAAPAQFASAQSAPAHTGTSSSQTNASTFEPLDRWRAAVLAGDKTALGALYSSVPPAQNQTPAGKTQDANEEPQFWSALAAQGLSDFHVKVLEIQRPQPGVVSIVLRAEFKLKTSSGRAAVRRRRG